MINVKEHSCERKSAMSRNHKIYIATISEKCEEMAEKIAEKTSLPVHLWDERRSTVEAHNILTDSGVFGKKRKGTVDAVAATLILEGFLAFRKNNK